MYLALAHDYPSFVPPPRNGGLLTPWAEQGVLMLNTCLTVRAHEAASHKNKGWEHFTQKVIDTVAKSRTRGVVFLAWGTPAQQRCKGLGTSGKNLVLSSVHPSPLSAHKGFLTCGHFKKTNEWLVGRYGDEGVINWNLDKPKPIAVANTVEPVKVTADQKEEVEKDGPTTEFVQEKQETGTTVGGVTASNNEDFSDDEDADAIEALEEIAHAELAAKKDLEAMDANPGQDVPEAAKAEDDDTGNVQEKEDAVAADV
jgi:Uracil DNA glycosylase superfamily